MFDKGNIVTLFLIICFGNIGLTQLFRKKTHINMRSLKKSCNFFFLFLLTPHTHTRFFYFKSAHDAQCTSHVVYSCIRFSYSIRRYSYYTPWFSGRVCRLYLERQCHIKLPGANQGKIRHSETHWHHQSQLVRR